MGRSSFTGGFATLARFSRSSRRALVLSSVVAVLATVVELVPLVVLALAVDDLVGGSADASRLLLYAGVAAVAVAARFGLWGWAMTISHVGAYEQLHAVRLGLANRLTRLPLGWFTHRHGGEVQRVLVDDVQKLELFVAHSVPETVSAVTTWGLVTAALAAVDWRLTLVALAPLALGYLVLHLGSRSTGANAARNAAADARLRARVAEHRAMQLEFRLFARDGWRPPVHGAIDERRDGHRAWLGRFAPYGSAYMTLVVASVAAIAPVGAFLVDQGSLDLSTLTVFLLVGIGYGTPLVKLRRTWYMLATISYAASVVDRVLGEEELPDTGVRRTLGDHTLRFDDVGFAYEDRKVLMGIDFEARPGTVTALVGPSGAGKTTIARLAARFWDVDEGIVSIGGVDVRDLAVDQLTETIGFVFQDAFLFTDTVAANLRRAAPSATDAELEAACRAARVHDEICALPAGYATVVGAGGQGLSGGQVQRIAIARVILRDAPIVILDEATAMVDPDGAAAIQDALAGLAAGRTVLVVAHRMPTVTGADQILVIDEGRITQRGTHQELVDQPGTYRRLWNDWQAAADPGTKAGVR